MSIAIIIATVIALIFSTLSLVTNTVRATKVKTAMGVVGSSEEALELVFKSNVEKFVHFILNVQTICIVYLAYYILSGDYNVY